MCNTSAYTNAINKQRLCSYGDWRVPSYDNLRNLADTNYHPIINPSYFPNTISDKTVNQYSFFWTSSSFAYNGDLINLVWVIDFNGTTYDGGYYKSNGLAVRLVRGGQ